MKIGGLSLTIGNVLRSLNAATMLLCLISSFSPNPKHYLVIFFILYVVYWIDIFGINTTFKLLNNLSSIESLHQKVVDMKLQGTPSIAWKMVCYHYETRTRTVKKKDSEGRTYHTYETYQERVNTWYGSETFRFDTWSDMSPDTLNVEDHRYIRWKMEKTYDFADDYTRNSYNYQKSAFEEANKWRDAYHTFEETFNIEGFVERTISSSDGAFPWQMSMKVYLLTCIFLFELVYSAWLKELATPQNYRFHKVFQCHNNLRYAPVKQSEFLDN